MDVTINQLAIVDAGQDQAIPAGNAINLSGMIGGGSYLFHLEYQRQWCFLMILLQ